MTELIPLEVIKYFKRHFEGNKVEQIEQTWDGLTFSFENGSKLIIKNGNLEVESYKVIKENFKIKGEE